jgi:hypothetical protein
MKNLYLFLAIIGFLLPYYFLVSFLLENGPNLGLLIDQLFANNISTFFAVDLIITGIVLLVFIYQDAHKLEMGNWWAYGIATLLVGPSFAMPLFLYYRESKLDTTSS